MYVCTRIFAFFLIASIDCPLWVLVVLFFCFSQITHDMWYTADQNVASPTSTPDTAQHRAISSAQIPLGL